MQKISGYLRQSKGETTRHLDDAKRKEILRNTLDVYMIHKLPLVLKGLSQNGREIWGYEYHPELFETSDITNKKIRYFIVLDDGRRAHPSELYPEIKQKDIDVEIEKRLQNEKENSAKKTALIKAINETKASTFEDAKYKYIQRYRSSLTNEIPKMQLTFNEKTKEFLFIFRDDPSFIEVSRQMGFEKPDLKDVSKWGRNPDDSLKYLK